MTRNHRLLKVEEKAKSLIERGIDQILGGTRLQRELVNALVYQIELSHHEGAICDEVWVHISPEDLSTLQASPQSLEKVLAQYLRDYTRESSLSSRFPISVAIVDDNAISPGEPLVCVGCRVRDAETTQTLYLGKKQDPMEEIRHLDAFLIRGIVHVPLSRRVLTIGRHLESDIVVDSKAASRRHAQIRWQQGAFVIHDLGSKAGTRKNGSLIRESVLRPGDVIDFAGVRYVYGEGLTPADPKPQRTGDDIEITQFLERPD